MTDVRTAVVRGVANTSGSTTQQFTHSIFGTSQPKAFKIAFCGRNVDGAEGATCQVSIGFSDGTHHASQSFTSQVNTSLGNERVWGRWSTDDVLGIISNTGVLVGQATVIAINGGCQITWLSFPTNPARLTITMYGGTGYQGTVSTLPSIGAGQLSAVSGLAFSPNAVEFGGGHTTNFASSPTIASVGRIGLGFATRNPSTVNAGAIWGESDNVATADTYGAVGTSCGYTLNTTRITSQITVTAWTANGFNFRENGGLGAGPAMMFLAHNFQNIGAGCGVESTPTSNGVVSHATSTAFQAQYVATADTAIDTKDLFRTTLDQSSSFGFGCAGPTNLTGVSCQAVREQDGKTLPFSAGGLANTEAVHMLVGSGGGVASIRASFVSFLPTGGFQRNYSVRQTTPRFFAWFTVGENPPAIVPEVRVTQDAWEVLYATQSGEVRVTQDAWEVLMSAGTGTVVEQRVTQDAWEILYGTDPLTVPEVRVTQDGWEILYAVAPPPPPSAAVVGPPQGQISRVRAGIGQVTSTRALDGQVSRTRSEQGQIGDASG